VGTVNCDEIRCDILQHKLDRLYFSCGEEYYIFPGYSYTVILGEDAIYNGQIEKSLPGISYSYPSNQFSDTIDYSTCRVIIETATIDSASEITLGILEFTIDKKDKDYAVSSIALDLIPDSSSHGNKINLIEYESEWEILPDFVSGKIDGIVSYRDFGSINPEVAQFGHPAPFFAAIMPNINREINSGGLLTNSIYYRFSTDDKYLIYSGHHIEPVNCLCGIMNACPRKYPYNPGKGKKLLTYLNKKPDQITLSYLDASLQELTAYFSDILNRDRIRAVTVLNQDDADICLGYVPYVSDDPTVCLKYILEFIKNKETESVSYSKTIDLMKGFLDLAEKSDTQSGQEHYCRLIEEVLLSEIGLFPLYRPFIYMAMTDNLTGYYFDKDGRLDLSNITRIKHPVHETENE
jgi:hypothetical protein